MQELYKMIEKVAPTSAHVLILGKSGTGKELVARELHNRSSFSKGPFVAVNCAALAEGLLESELFGHEKGSFTGATAMQRGKFEVASGGTLFLDEIGELGDNLQVKLLRFLQEKEFQRVGGNNNIKVDVRITAATNKNLKEDVQNGCFREDLFYRLNTVILNLPSLKERLDDMEVLANHYVEKLNREFGKNLEVAPQTIAVMKQYEWPGNVRELENIMTYMVITAEGKLILPEHLPFYSKLNSSIVRAVDPDEQSMGISSRLVSIERDMILEALEASDWNQVKAAQVLGMKRTTLQYKIQKYKLTPPVKETNRS